MNIKSCLLAAATVALSATFAFAQSGSGSGSAPGKGGAKQPQSDISKKCSAEATAQNLKGNPRRAFRRKCIADARRAAGSGKGSGSGSGPGSGSGSGSGPGKK